MTFAKFEIYIYGVKAK